MEGQEKSIVSIPRYQKIAIEIASKIANEEYAVGEKIFGRSFVASQYEVSPETARRAFCILSDLGIVAPEKGSGMYIKSRENAVAFLKQFDKRTTLETIGNDITQSIRRQQKEMTSLHNYLTELIGATEHFRSMNPLMPFSLRLTEQCQHLHKTIQELQLWQHTGATLIAIKRDGILLRSPGPYATLEENDIIYFISQDDSDQKVRMFLF
ncbi:MAG: TrkA C-terminal domain-containing protein [Lawsonibacter sp.]